MRLIDADELMEHVWRDKLDSRELIAKMIDNAPTVKEIPINVFEQLISQDSVLDKIRSEIEEHAKINQNLNTDRAKTLCWCLTVIDKYKEESEGIDENSD